MILFLFKILARSFDDFFLFFLLVGMGWPHYSNSWIPLSYSFYWTLVVWCVHFLRVPTQWHPLKPRNTTFMRQLLLVFKKRSQCMHPFDFTLLPPLSPPLSLRLLSFQMTCAPFMGCNESNPLQNKIGKEIQRWKKIIYSRSFYIEFTFNFCIIIFLTPPSLFLVK